MDKKEAIEICTVLKNEYVGIVNKVLKNRLGVNVNMKPVYSQGRSDCYIYLIAEDNRDVENKMMGNKLLRHLFSSAELKVTVWVFDNSFSFLVDVFYKHPDGGSNGHDLMTFHIMKDSYKVKFNKTVYR